MNKLFQKDAESTSTIGILPCSFVCIVEIADVDDFEFCIQ